MCKAELNRNKKTLLTVFIGITISMVFIIGSSNSLLNIALSKSSHHSKSSTATTNGLGISSGRAIVVLPSKVLIQVHLLHQENHQV